MKYIIIGAIVVAVLFICFQGLGLLLILTMLKKQEQNPEQSAPSDAAPDPNRKENET